MARHGTPLNNRCGVAPAEDEIGVPGQRITFETYHWGFEVPVTMQTYLDPSREQGRAFFTRGIAGSVVMLNLLRFRPTADYSAAPALMPGAPISGEQAYRLYIDHTLPFLKASGGELLFYGRGGDFLIGPANERWDAAMLVRQAGVASFLAFASNRDYLAGMAHRVAALEDSRLLPLIDAQV